MKNHRAYHMLLTTSVVALAVTATPVIAAELLGMITKVNVDEQTLTVVEKETANEVVFKTNAETSYVTKKGESIKLDLQKLARALEKSKESGKKGISVKVGHKDGTVQVLYIDPKGP